MHWICFSSLFTRGRREKLDESFNKQKDSRNLSWRDHRAFSFFMAGVVCFADVGHAASFPRYKVCVMLLAFTVGLNQKDGRGGRKIRCAQIVDFSILSGTRV